MCHIPMLQHSLLIPKFRIIIPVEKVHLFSNYQMRLILILGYDGMLIDLSGLKYLILHC